MLPTSTSGWHPPLEVCPRFVEICAEIPCSPVVGAPPVHEFESRDSILTRADLSCAVEGKISPVTGSACFSSLS